MLKNLQMLSFTHFISTQQPSSVCCFRKGFNFFALPFLMTAQFQSGRPLFRTVYFHTLIRLEALAFTINAICSDFSLNTPLTCSHSSLVILDVSTSPGFIEHCTSRFWVSSVTALMLFNKLPTKLTVTVPFYNIKTSDPMKLSL